MTTAERADHRGRAAADDVVALAQRLLRCASVTPRDAGAAAVVAEAAAGIGCEVDAFVAEGGGQAVHNLIATLGHGPPVLAFAGHLDVVPAGDLAGWRRPPFAGELDAGALWGRGAVDMKGALAAFLAAVARAVRGGWPASGTLLLLVTGDEEDGGERGMRAVLERLAAGHPSPEACLIGEPSCEGHLGQGMRVGRRGSLNVEITSAGVAGHVAWPARARNALHALLDAVGEIRAMGLGGGEACFPPSHLEVTGVEADSAVGNVIPGRARARLNIRFNRRHTGDALCRRIEAITSRHSPHLRASFSISGEPYLSAECRLAEIVADACAAVTGERPEANAGGGVSDGRFIRRLCPVIEFGLVGDLAHKTDEHVPVAHLHALVEIYGRVLANFFVPPR